MNERDNELLEAELRKLTPARPPDEFMARLAEAGRVTVDQASQTPKGLGLRQSSGAFCGGGVNPNRQRTRALQNAAASNQHPRPSWWSLLRWLAPAASAALAAALLVWWHPAHSTRLPAKALTASLNPQPSTLNPSSDIEIDRQLVALYDAVAQLPSGQPVRFRCREWADQIVFRDPARGLVIERHTPRLEVVAVGLEMY